MRLTVRDLIWLTLVVALSVTWWLDARRRDERTKDEQTMYQVMRDDNLKLERENDLLHKQLANLKAKSAVP